MPGGLLWLAGGAGCAGRRGLCRSGGLRRGGAGCRRGLREPPAGLERPAGRVRWPPAGCAGRGRLLRRRAGAAVRADAGLLSQQVSLIGLLPGEVVVVAPEVTVGGRLAVDRPAQVELADERPGTQVEVLVDQLGDALARNPLGAVGLDHRRERVRHADRVGKLDLAAIGQPRRDDVLGHVAGRVGGRAVDLRRVLAREGAAAVARSAAVGVDDDLAAGQAGVAHRAADLELAGRVDQHVVAQLAVGVELRCSRRAAPAGSRAPRGRA